MEREAFPHLNGTKEPLMMMVVGSDSLFGRAGMARAIRQESRQAIIINQQLPLSAQDKDYSLWCYPTSREKNCKKESDAGTGNRVRKLAYSIMFLALVPPNFDITGLEGI